MRTFSATNKTLEQSFISPVSPLPSPMSTTEDHNNDLEDATVDSLLSSSVSASVKKVNFVKGVILGNEFSCSQLNQPLEPQAT